MTPRGRLDKPGIRFPAEFSFGVSTSSYQIEGAVNAGGRGPSIWDTFSHTPGRVMHGDTGDIACNHYDRLEEDLDLLAELGVDVYRFSIAWPRIQATGMGARNPAGIGFYRRLIEGLHARNIKPVPTLYHWDLPQALQDRGGWASREIVTRFEEYANIVVSELGDVVSMWTTLNEPWVATYMGYRAGHHAPGIADEAQAAAAHHHMLLSHARAVHVVRAAGGAQVGIALNMSHVYAVSEHADDQAAADLADCQLNRAFLDPLFHARYPSELGSLGERWREGRGIVQRGDMESICAPVDFLSINTYQPRHVCAPARIGAARSQGYVGGFAAPLAFGLPLVDVEPGNAPRTDMGWIIEPKGLEDLLLRLGRELPELPLYVSENGAAFADYTDPEGRVIDSERIDYFDAHLHAAHDAMARGVNLRGYWAWSLLDNFEWSYGYSKRFGLIYIDYPSSTRIPKASFRWFQQLIADHRERAAAATRGSS